MADPGAPLELQQARSERLRLILTALIDAAFHGVAWLLWPRSLGPLLERVRQARAEALPEAELAD